MVRLPTDRPPTHPGEALREDFLPDAGLTQSAAARRLRMSFRRLNEIINGRRAVTPDTALRLGRLFGQTPDFWMNLQMRWDLYHALRSQAARDLDRIDPIAAA
jgi:addiction module HigA family antidote